jgi:hypothetical protein
MRRAIVVCGCIVGIVGILGCSGKPAPEYETVDDFESYTNDSPKRVSQSWIDGLGFSPDEFFPSGGAGNGTGAIVATDLGFGDTMGTTIVHGGSRSMPLCYCTDYAPKVAEATRTFEPARDWTQRGLTTLVLYFHGDVNNVGAPLYVKINDVKVVYNNGTACTTTPAWTQWNIDLARLGESLKAVKTLTIGVGDGSAFGMGMIFIEDIRLYRKAPPVTAPIDPDTNG